MTPVWFQPLLFGNVGLTEMISFNHKAEFTFGFMSWPGFLWGVLRIWWTKTLGHRTNSVRLKSCWKSASLCAAINSLNKVFIFAINFIPFFMNKLYGCNGFADFSLFAICAPFNIIRAAKEDGWTNGRLMMMMMMIMLMGKGNERLYAMRIWRTGWNRKPSKRGVFHARVSLQHGVYVIRKVYHLFTTDFYAWWEWEI